MTRRQGRRRKKLLDDLKDRRGYCELKEEALDRTMWRNRFARGFGPVVWQITDDDDDDNCLYSRLTEDELSGSKHVEDNKNYNIGLEKVHFVGLYCVIILQFSLQKNLEKLYNSDYVYQRL